MEITPWTIYLWQLADSLKNSLDTGVIIGIALSGVIILFTSISIADSCAEDAIKELKKWRGRGVLALIVSMMIGFTQTLIPSSNTIAMMVIIPKIANSKVIQKDLPDLYNAAVEAMKEQLNKK